MSTRILQMGMGELTTRGRQEAMKWIERRMRPKGGLGPRAPRGPASVDLERSFFRGATDGETPSFLRALDPGIVERTAVAADAIAAGRFDLLGYEALSFGNPIDWHLDPISGRRAPRVHWSRIDPLDPEALGDARLVWELNRHVWLVTLGRAYRLTGHDLYAEVAASRLRAWMRENPPGLGNTGPAPWLDLRKPASPVPAGLISGCFVFLPESKFCNYGPADSVHRVKHDYLNKDKGRIDPKFGAAGTSRGGIEGNFQRAVEAAIADARDKWATLSEALIVTYGNERGQRMICAITHDRPARDCK